MYYIGVDCGGTNIRVGLVSPEGKVLIYDKRKSPLRTHPQDFGVRVSQVAGELLESKSIKESELGGIGVGVPGPLDLERGAILPNSANLANKEPILIKDQLQQYFGNIPIFIDRDTNASLRGEAWKGAAKTDKNVLMLTLGTGVGGAIIVDGRIDEGQSGMAGEVGHMFLSVPDLSKDQDNLPVCGLGHRGCFESFIRSSQEPEKIGFYLGYALANLVDIFNPQKIVIGGGRVKSGNFLPKAVEVMKERGMRLAVKQVRVEYSKLGDLAGIIGAAKLVIDSTHS